MNVSQMRAMTVNEIAQELRNVGINTEATKLQFSNAEWVIKLYKHPVKLVSYSKQNYKVVFMTGMVEVKEYPTLRGLRAKFKGHQIKIKSRTETAGKKYVVVVAKIKDTEPVTALIDSLKAAEYLVENIPN